jgi:hypothetical protein
MKLWTCHLSQHCLCYFMKSVCTLVDACFDCDKFIIVWLVFQDFHYPDEICSSQCMHGVSTQSVRHFLHFARPIHGHDRESLHYNVSSFDFIQINRRFLCPIYVWYTIRGNLYKKVFYYIQLHEYFLGHCYAVDSYWVFHRQQIWQGCLM